MRLTLVHPCIGRKRGQPYIKSWQMEPLAPALIAALTPGDVEVRFHDDRMEEVPFDEPSDLVAISVETYTARRSYEIATEYRRRGVPVVMGGFHPTLVPGEAAVFADAVVVGEAEAVWPELIDDFRSGSLKELYRSPARPVLSDSRPDRRIFRDKRYLPIGLVEAGRGCHFRCEFCAVQSFFGSTQNRRDVDSLLSEIRSLPQRLLFFVDDNITSNMDEAKEFFRALIPLGRKWVSQASINAAHDEEFLDLIKRSGCQGLLIGFESLDPETLRRMHKGFNTMAGGYERALSNLRRFRIPLYATFLFGNDEDTHSTFRDVLEFCEESRFFIVAFNHVTPFPGTPLYKRLQDEGRLRFERWWLHPAYRYGDVPFHPRHLTCEEVRDGCLKLRGSFYRWGGIARRSLDLRVNAPTPFMWGNFFLINMMIRSEVRARAGYPLGDESFMGPLAARAGDQASISSSVLEQSA